MLVADICESAQKLGDRCSRSRPPKHPSTGPGATLRARAGTGQAVRDEPDRAVVPGRTHEVEATCEYTITAVRVLEDEPASGNS